MCRSLLIKGTWLKQSVLFVGLGITLLLVSCQSTQQPYFQQESGGNSWATTLNKDSVILPSNPQSLKVAFNEIDDKGVLREDLILVNKEYLKEQYERELNMIKEIQILKLNQK